MRRELKGKRLLLHRHRGGCIFRFRFGLPGPGLRLLDESAAGIAFRDSLRAARTLRQWMVLVEAIDSTHRVAPFEGDPYDKCDDGSQRGEGQIPPPSGVIFEDIDVHAEETLEAWSGLLSLKSVR